MIEYVLITSILERICKMTKKPLEYPRDDTKLAPSNICLKLKHGEHMEEGNWQNRRMGGMVMGKCEDGQRKSFYNETNCEHFK